MITGAEVCSVIVHVYHPGVNTEDPDFSPRIIPKTPRAACVNMRHGWHQVIVIKRPGHTR